MSPILGRENTAPLDQTAANGKREFTRQEYLKIEELVTSNDPYIAAWAADRLNERFQANYEKAHKKAAESQITQGMEEAL